MRLLILLAVSAVGGAACTVEGDPIRTYVRIAPDGAIEIFVDATEDKFGPHR